METVHTCLKLAEAYDHTSTYLRTHETQLQRMETYFKRVQVNQSCVHACYRLMLMNLHAKHMTRNILVRKLESIYAHT